MLVNRARSFVFTTALAPALVAAAGAALEVLAREPERRERLLDNARRMRAGLLALGFEIGGDTHILPVMLGDNRLALAMGEALLTRGVLVQPIRPPTVPPGTARLRVTPVKKSSSSSCTFRRTCGVSASWSTTTRSPGPNRMSHTPP